MPRPNADILDPGVLNPSGGTTSTNTRTINGVVYTRDPSGYWRDPFGQIGNIVPGENPITGFPDPTNPVFEPLDKWLQPDPNGSGGGALDMRPREFDDPRYWDLQYQQLQQDLLNSGLDAESARRTALAGLITNRNATAANLYATGVDAAKAGAQFAGNPRDAMSDLYFRNAMGNRTPYGDMSGQAGTDLQQGLFNRFEEIFGGIAGDRARAWDFVSAIPPAEFLQPAVTPGGDINRNTTLPAGGTGGTATGASAPQTNETAGALQFLQAMTDPQKAADFRKYVTGGVPGAAHGGTFNFDPGVGNEETGFTPTSTEGGLNMNIFEPAVIMGVDSGRIYAKLAEPRPDGTRRGEQVVIKPLKSETEKDKQYQEMGKAPVSGGMPGVPGAAGGGTVNAIPKPWDFLNELKKNLQGLGGTGGGAGGATDPNTGVAPLRMYAGAPEAMMSPTQREYLYAAQSAAGVSPEEVDWTLKLGTPNAIINNLPRVAF